MSVSPRRLPPSSPPRPVPRAFTLVELLVVMGLILVLISLVGPAMNSLKNSNDLTSAAYDINGVMEQARAYAISHNTYVFVGISEVDSNKDPSASPQATPKPPDVGGRVVLAVVASKDGTRGYDVKSSPLPDPAWSNYNKGGNLLAISKLYRFENIHLAPLFSTLPNSGGLARPTVTGSYQMGNVTDPNNPSKAVTPFEWPLGKDLGQGQYTFRRVINFDSDGVPRVQFSTNNDALTLVMEIGLQPSRGSATIPTPASGPGNVAALQIDGLTGVTRIFRP